MDNDIVVRDLKDDEFNTPEYADVSLTQVIVNKPIIKQMFEHYSHDRETLSVLAEGYAKLTAGPHIVSFSGFKDLMSDYSDQFESASKYTFAGTNTQAKQNQTVSPDNNANDQNTEIVVAQQSVKPEQKATVVQEFSYSVPSAKNHNDDAEQTPASSMLKPEGWKKNIAEVIQAHPEDAEASDERKQWAADTAQQLRYALMSYGMKAAFSKEPQLTPNGVSVQFKGTDSLTEQTIKSHMGKLLTSKGLRVINVTPGVGTITVSVASEDRATVSLMSLWHKRKFNFDNSGFNSAFVIGLQESDGELLYLNFEGSFAGREADAPHTLIAGTSGSGKSVLMNSIILDIAATNSSKLAKLLLIDPKQGVEFGVFNTLPHMLKPTVIDKEQAVEELNALVVEMDHRYELLSSQMVKNISSYNKKVGLQDALPRIFVVHDEFAEWMMDKEYKEAVTTVVNRLGVKARAAGIHLIFAAQRPDKDVMPMQLRSNLGNRLILKVEDAATSNIALDSDGAERLLGKGHMLARLNGQFISAQAPFIPEDQLGEVIEAIRKDNA